VLQGFSRSEKLEELQSFLAKSRRTDPEGNRRKPANVIDEEWSNWNDNWDRVMHRGVLS